MMHHLVQRFNFNWSENHFVNCTDAYTVKLSALDAKDSSGFERIVAFIEG